jgi:histone demethylase JARID1
MCLKAGCSLSRYRYTLDDLYPMMNALKLRAESYNEWALNVNEALEAKINKKKST